MNRLIATLAAAALVGALPIGQIAFADAESSSEQAVSAEARTDIGEALDTFLESDGDALLLLPEELDKSQLDFSIESLKSIDAWLSEIHDANREDAGDAAVGEMFVQDGRGDNSVMFAGLYLGEVIRQNSEQSWAWQPFDVFVANNPAHAEYFGPAAGFDEYLLVSDQGVATPINAALKRVLNGSIDSVHYIGMFLSAPIDIDAALSGARSSEQATDPI